MLIFCLKSGSLTLDNNAIGFSSINPSNPNEIHMGHNVILPKYQNKGIGKKQLEEQLDRCLKWNMKEVWAITGTIPFFLSAREMYKSLGFKIISDGKNNFFQTIKFRKKL